MAGRITGCANGVRFTVNAMLELRYYQRNAIDSLYRYFEGNDGNPLVVLPTGTGKSLVIAKLIEEATAAWPDTRFIVATHVKELVAQDYAEFMNLSPFAPAGIYSAGLNRRDAKAQILFCGIQSVYDKAYDLQRCDLLLIDEAHTLPHSGDGMWRTFLSEMKKINSQMRIVGLTATDYRLDSGLLTTPGKDDEPPIFTDVCYEYTLTAALDDGYLCPIVPTSMATRFDLSGVGSRGGEYIAGELERAVNVDGITHAAIGEIEAYGHERKAWLIFSAGNKHAAAIHSELQKRGYAGAVVTQDTPKAERAKAVDDIRQGNIRYLVNNRIFTTGFNAPNIDLIADLAPTKSPGLHVQKLGRGTRLCEGKENCVLLDFARNVEYHGPLDKIRGKDKNGGEGDAPVKVCPGLLENGNPCGQVLFAGIRKCFVCGHEFDQEGPDIRSTGGSSAVLSSQIEPEWRNVIGWSRRYNKKEGKEHATMLVTYSTIEGRVYEAVCFDHPRGGYAHNQAVKWHVRMMPPGIPMPKSVKDGVDFKYYECPSRILVRPEGKFWRVVDCDFSKPETKSVADAFDDVEIPF